MEVTIFHNPRCGTSRKALAAIEARGLRPRIVDYVKEGWNAQQLETLFSAAGVTPRAALRMKQPEAAAMGLDAPDATDAAIIAAMVRHPALVERPFVVTAKGARLCRPLERIDEIL